MTDQRIGWGALLSGMNGIRSLALAGGVALHAINVYVATTIMPSVVADIGGLDYYAWSTTLFVVASIIGSALSVVLLKAMGPRGAYGISAALFGIGTLICAIAPNMAVLLIGRAVQGFGGGLLFALAYAMIRLVFAPELWPRAMAIVSGMWGVATLIGPAIGGTFAELGAWRAAFWSVVPVTVLFAVLAVAVLPRKDQADKTSVNVPFAQLVLLVLAVLAVSLGSVRPELVWNIAGIIAALILLAGLIVLDGKSRKRLLPKGTFSLASPLAMLFITISMLAITVTASEIFIPLFLQVLHGQTPLIAGYLAVLMSVGWTAGSIGCSGAEGSNVGRAIILAPALSLIGMVVLAVLFPAQSHGALLPLAAICTAFFAVGLGVGIGWPHLLTRILKVAPEGEQDLASTAITTIQLFATAFGSALAGMVVNLAGLGTPGGIAGTASAAFWLFATVALAPALGFITALRSVRLSRQSRAGIAVASG